MVLGGPRPAYISDPGGTKAFDGSRADVIATPAAITIMNRSHRDIPGSPSTWPQSWQMSLIGPIKPLHLGHGISLLLYVENQRMQRTALHRL
jgi:hypothetical protein